MVVAFALGLAARQTDVIVLFLHNPVRVDPFAKPPKLTLGLPMSACELFMQVLFVRRHTGQNTIQHGTGSSMWHFRIGRRRSA